MRTWPRIAWTSSNRDLPIATSVVRPPRADGQEPKCRPLPVTFALRVQSDVSGSKRNRAGDLSEAGNQRLQEFWVAISGCERNP